MPFQSSHSVPEFRNDCQKQWPWNQLTITRATFRFDSQEGPRSTSVLTLLQRDTVKGESIASEEIRDPGGAGRAGSGQTPRERHERELAARDAQPAQLGYSILVPVLARPAGRPLPAPLPSWPPALTCPREVPVRSAPPPYPPGRWHQSPDPDLRPPGWRGWRRSGPPPGNHTPHCRRRPLVQCPPLPSHWLMAPAAMLKSFQGAGDTGRRRRVRRSGVHPHTPPHPGLGPS